MSATDKGESKKGKKGGTFKGSKVKGESLYWNIHLLNYWN